MFFSHPPTQVTPITDFPVPAMNLASEELIRSQAKELKEEKILMQVRKLYNVRGISHVQELSQPGQLLDCSTITSTH